MKFSLRRVAVVCWGMAAAQALPAQPVVSARSGLLHYFEGRVYVNESAVQRKPHRFPQVAPLDVVRSGANGRAEILAAPDAFLRLGERSAVRLISDSLLNPSYELLSGSLILEAQELPKGTTLTVRWGTAVITVNKRSIFRLDSSPRASVRVHEGEVLVEQGSAKSKVRKGRLLPLDGAETAMKFDLDSGDRFDLWSVRRSSLLAAANWRGRRTGRPPWRGRPPSFPAPAQP